MPKTETGALARRDQILRSTVSLLLEVGLSAATTRGVTQRAGVGTGLLNHYYRWPELRAAAWRAIFDAVADDQFPTGQPPDHALEHYFETAFTPDARQYWQLWIEAVELAAHDEAMAGALRDAQARLHNGLAGTLRAGCDANHWRLADPGATALRLGALYDGLAGLLISGAAQLDAEEAEAHLRAAFQRECDDE